MKQILMMTPAIIRGGGAVAILCATLTIPQQGRAQQKPGAANPPDLQGVYQSIPDNVTLPGGLKNAGSPSSIPLLPAAVEQAKSIDVKKDPWKMCQPVGPFRMMAAEQVKIELVPVSGMLTMLYEDLSHGMRRSILLKRGHPAKLAQTWLGDSVGRWEGDTLVVDTAGFNDQTWLNGKGAQHSDALHLVERVRPILAGQYLEYKVTVEDPKTLAKPYSYMRYFKKLDTEVVDDPCQNQE
jgi:hypothetical protein